MWLSVGRTLWESGAVQNLAFTFSNVEQASRAVTATPSAFGRAHTSVPFATMLASTVPWLPFVAKWRKLASQSLQQTGLKCQQQSETHATRHNEELLHRQCA